MPGLVSDISIRARLAARAAAFTVAGIVFAMTGLAFLTVALWVLLATYEGVLAAWTVIGLMYMALGIAFLVIAKRRHPALPPVAPIEPVQPIEPFLRVAEAFAVGLNAGRAARRPRD